jgi:hypothetical protein
MLSLAVLMVLALGAPLTALAGVRGQEGDDPVQQRFSPNYYQDDPRVLEGAMAPLRR